MTRTRALLLTLLIAVVLPLLLYATAITTEPILPHRQHHVPIEGNVVSLDPEPVVPLDPEPVIPLPPRPVSPLPLVIPLPAR